MFASDAGAMGEGPGDSIDMAVPGGYGWHPAGAACCGVAAGKRMRCAIARSGEWGGERRLEGMGKGTFDCCERN